MNDFTITLDSLELDTDVIELPELYAPVTPGPRGFRGREGRDAKPVAPEVIAHLVADAVARIPRAKDGEPGKPGEPGLSVDPASVEQMLNDMVSQAVSRIPRAKDGEPGRPGLTLPGKPGKDGKDADPALIERLVFNAVARIPKPKDGKTVHSQGDQGLAGLNGWTPVLALEKSGQREYLKLTDWIGGTGEKPPTGYITRTGELSDSKSSAVNLRGSKGEDGTNGGGRNGLDGQSAYQVATANGFVGTEEEWLISLHGADGTGSGGSTSIEAIADGTVNGHRAVRVTGAGKVALANSSDPATAGTVIGIALTAALDGHPVTVQVIGEIDEPTFNFTPGPVYFNAIGALTQTVPASGYIQQIAVALDTTEISVQIGPPIVLN